MRNLLGACLLALLLPLAAAAAPVRIVVFGDSLTAGYGLPASQGFVAQLGKWLKARGADVVLVNAGLSGDTTYGGRVRIGWALRGGADAVIVELGGNDLLMRFQPEKAEANLRAIIASARGRGGRPVLVLGIYPFSGETEWIARWRAIWPRLAARSGVRLVPDIYAGIRAAQGKARLRLLQPDRLHASAEGVATMVAVAGPQVLGLVAEAEARRAQGAGVGVGVLPAE